MSPMLFHSGDNISLNRDVCESRVETSPVWMGKQPNSSLQTGAREVLQNLVWRAEFRAPHKRLGHLRMAGIGPHFCLEVGEVGWDPSTGKLRCNVQWTCDAVGFSTGSRHTVWSFRSLLAGNCLVTSDMTGRAGFCADHLRWHIHKHRYCTDSKMSKWVTCVCGQFPLWESTATRKRSSSICVWKLVAWGSWKLWAACWQNLESCKWKGSEIMSSWFQVVKNSLGSFWFWDCVAIPSSSQAESTPFNDFGSDFSNFSSGFLQLDSSMSPVWSRCEAKKVPITKLPRRRWCAVVWFQHWCPRGWEQLAKQERTLNQWYETVL